MPIENTNPWLENPSSMQSIDRLINEEMHKGNPTLLYINPMKGTAVSEQEENVHFDNFAKQILLAGTDFSKNFFDTFLFAVNANDQIQKDAFNNMYEYTEKSEVLRPFTTVGMYSFTTRTTKVEIPIPKAATFDYVVGSQTIRKIKSEWDMTKKSSLSMRIDGLTYYIDAINLLSQNNEVANDAIDNKSINFLSFTGLNKNLSEHIKNGIRLDLVVRHVNPSEEMRNPTLKHAERALYSSASRKSSYAGMVNSRPDNARSMFWLFEDVRFLGWNDGLEFGHTSTGPQELTTEFTFKRLIRVDPMFMENYLGNPNEQIDIGNNHLPSEFKVKLL